jgi:Fumarate reductase flavoprotein C-term
LTRQESRVAHYRSDFPNLGDEEWKGNIYCRKEGSEIVLFKDSIKERNPRTIGRFPQVHIKAEHHREFE